MIALELFGKSPEMTRVAELLEGAEGINRVRLVTTIPAAAYLGVAAGLGEIERAGGALGVLSTNVVMLVVGASVTLALRRRS